MSTNEVVERNLVSRGEALASPDEAREPSAVAALTTEDLRAELGRALEVTARHLTYLAAVWRELERRGEDLSGLRSGLWAYMPLIAAGRLRAEVVVRYAGHSMLLRRLAELPGEDQERLLRDDTVTVVEHRDGGWVEQRVPVTHLRAQQIGQVIAGGRIRPPAEQRRAALGASRRAPPRRTPMPGHGPEAVVALALEQPRRTRGRSPLHVSVSLDAAERAALEEHAERHGLTVATLVRAALLSAGLLDTLEAD